MTQELSDRRLENQLEALRSAIRGTNADLITLITICKQNGLLSEELVIQLTGDACRRVESLNKLNLSQNPG